MKPLKVPTMPELEKAAAKCNAVVRRDKRPWSDSRLRVIGREHNDRADFWYDADIESMESHARYLAGEHIEALKRMQEAGL